MQEDTFAEGFVKTYKQMKAQYGFDGIDIDVESSLTTPLLSAFRKVFKILHDEGEIISMAPESPSLVSPCPFLIPPSHPCRARTGVRLST